MTILELQLAKIIAEAARRRHVILVRPAYRGQSKRMKDAVKVRRVKHE